MRHTADPGARHAAPPHAEAEAPSAAGSVDAPASPPADGAARSLAGSVAAHAVLALGLGLTAGAADELPLAWHAPLGAATAALFALWLAWGLWRRAPRVQPLLDAALPALRLALAAALALLLAAGALLGHETWGARVAVDQAHEALAAGVAALLGLHAVVEWGVLGWARWGRRPA